MHIIYRSTPCRRLGSVSGWKVDRGRTDVSTFTGRLQSRW